MPGPISTVASTPQGALAFLPVFRVIIDRIIDSLLIGLGGALGSLGRFFISGWVAARFGQNFPWGTLLVNISGSFLIGIFAAMSAPENPFFIPARLRNFLMIGICGGYTTFSSFSLQTLTLAQEGEWLRAAFNIFLSITCCLVAVWLGYVAVSGWLYFKGRQF